jgi:uncharacterized protein
MILKNLTTRKIITHELKEAKSLSDRFLGLLKKSNPRFLLFKTRFGIHTFFLKEPIDVVILDEDLKVVKLKENLKPNRLFLWNPIYSLIIEVPKGYTQGKIKIQDRLSF